jgi:hypothetical protein
VGFLTLPPGRPPKCPDRGEQLDLLQENAL